MTAAPQAAQTRQAPQPPEAPGSRPPVLGTVPRRAVVALTLAALVVTAVMPWVPHREVLAVVGALLALLVLVGMVVGVGREGRAHEARHRSEDGRFGAWPRLTWAGTPRTALALFLHLSPVLLLGLAFPVAAERMDAAHVGSTPLRTVMLASSVTVPWLGQAVCLPLYRAIGHLLPARPAALPEIERAFVAAWPTTFLQTLPVVAVFAVPVQWYLRLDAAGLATYLALCMLHVGFTQSLVLTNVATRRPMWAVAWAAYALALLAAPTWWFLPPLAGLATQVVPLLRRRRTALRPLPLAQVAVDLVRGLVLGSVLWADKVFLFIVYRGEFSVDLVFLAMLPTVLAYNYYFVRLAPGFDDGVHSFRQAMSRMAVDDLGRTADRLVEIVVGTLTRTGFVGALLGLALVCGVVGFAPGRTDLVARVVIASWLFMMITLACYKLDYVGQRASAAALSAAHLLACVVLFVVWSSTTAYLPLVAVDAVLCAVAVVLCLRQWRSPQYTLFWRQAVTW